MCPFGSSLAEVDCVWCALSCVVDSPVMLRFDAYGFLHLLVFNHPFHITCMKDIVSFHTYVMANLEHDLFLCHVLAAHYGHCDDNQL